MGLPHTGGTWATLHGRNRNPARPGPRSGRHPGRFGRPAGPGPSNQADRLDLTDLTGASILVPLASGPTAPPMAQPDGLDPLPDEPSGSSEPSRDEAGMGQTWEDVRRFQAGEPEALGRLYSRYRERVARYVRIRMGARLRAREDPEDLVSKTFEVAIRNLKSFEMREPGAMIHWLGTIAENQIRDRIKYWEQDKRNWDRDRPLHAWAPEDGTSPDPEQLLADSLTPPPDRAARKELNEIVDECIEELSPDYQEVILLRDIAGASLRYTAEAMGRSTGEAVAMLHARAWGKLIQATRRRFKVEG